MKRRDLIQKIFLGGTTLIFLPSVLNSCSKSQEESKQEKTLTIDLNDQANAALLTMGGFVVINNKIIVAKTGFGDLPYAAANSYCPSCKGNLKYTGSSYVVWECSDCHSKFGWDGAIYNGPSTDTLKVYTVSKSGNILTVHLGKPYVFAINLYSNYLIYTKLFSL